MGVVEQADQVAVDGAGIALALEPSVRRLADFMIHAGAENLVPLQPHGLVRPARALQIVLAPVEDIAHPLQRRLDVCYVLLGHHARAVQQHHAPHVLSAGGHDGRRVRPHGMADEEGVFQPQRVHNGDGVVRVLHDAAVRIGGGAVAPAPKVVGDYPVFRRQGFGDQLKVVGVSRQGVDAEHRPLLPRPLHQLKFMVSHLHCILFFHVSA
ncbi:hypothetical protein SDC9_121367 [bioreactor metagenome]|uniref:Uncharacterized protein n=1 Tax=bioreactor metagenome TaxID=1076179 RepID=A0A645CBS3_9ZZZZ